MTAQITTDASSGIVSFIALGANLGDAKSTLLAAIESLTTLPDCHLIARSSLYRSAPYEATGPDFYNAVIALQSSLDAHELLLKLQQIENQSGRLRPYPNAPRTLDLDLLLYGEAHIDTSTLQVPHPRMWQRAFVLLPLAEIAPELVSPALLAAVSDQVIERLT